MLDLCSTHIAWIAFVLKQHKALYPIHIGVLGARAVMLELELELELEPDLVLNLIQQSGVLHTPSQVLLAVLFYAMLQSDN
jgi:hypothetical protein